MSIAGNPPLKGTGARAWAGRAFGWWLGEHVGLMTAFLISTVGTGAGFYWGRQIADTYT